MEHVKFVGLAQIRLSDEERQKIFNTAAAKATKFHDYVRNEHEVIVHVKEHEPDGKRHRYEIHTRISYTGNTLAIKAEDWELISGIQRSFEELEVVLKHRYKGNVKHLPSAADVYEAPGIGIR